AGPGSGRGGRAAGPSAFGGLRRARCRLLISSAIVAAESVSWSARIRTTVALTRGAPTDSQRYVVLSCIPPRYRKATPTILKLVFYTISAEVIHSRKVAILKMA